MLARSLLLVSASACLVLALLAVCTPVASAQPVLYVTMHGGKSGVNNIYSYDLNGNPISEGVLQGDDNLDGLRSGLIMPDGTLLLANAHKTDSRIAQYSTCDGEGNRDYIADFATSNLAHPYGLALGFDAANGDEVVWATNQDTYDLVQFGTTGSFQEQVKQFGTEELRSIAFDNKTNVLYIANEDEDAVLAYDTKQDSFVSSLSFTSITDPIGLYVDEEQRLLFIGSNGSPAAVYAYNLDTRALNRTFTDSGLNHPAGLVSYGESLFVIDQKAQSVLEFNVASGELVGTPIASFPDVPEQIWLSDC